MKTGFLRMMVLGVAISLSGCETLGGLFSDEDSESSFLAGATGIDGEFENADKSARSQGLQQDDEFSATALTDPDSPLSKRVIYFSYDSTTVRSEFMPMVKAHARYLARHSNVRITLQGHTDERGSREYNVALGEQRARSIARKLGVLGAGDEQLRVISYGEEKPASHGHDEQAWHLNRRVEIVYPRN